MEKTKGAQIRAGIKSKKWRKKKNDFFSKSRKE